MENLYLPLNSQVYTFTSELGEMVIREMYNIDRGLELRVNKVGSWDGYHLKWDISSFFERRKDMHGFQIQAAAVPSHPLITIIKNKEGVQIGGLIGEVWHGILEKTLNMSTNITLTSC